MSGVGVDKKERFGRITKMGDRYLRKLLVVGMTAVVRHAKRTPGTVDPNLIALLARKPARVVERPERTPPAPTEQTAQSVSKTASA